MKQIFIQLLSLSLTLNIAMAQSNGNPPPTDWPESICYPALAEEGCPAGMEFITADLNFGIDTFCIKSSWWPMSPEKNYYPNKLNTIVSAKGADLFTKDIEITVRKSMQIVCEFEKTYPNKSK